MDKKTFQGSMSSIAFWILLITIFLLPIFFIPITGISLGIAKGFLFAIAVSISFLFWLISCLKRGEVSFPKSSILLSFGVVALVFLISSLFSPAVSVSMFGFGNETGTFITVLLLFLLMFLSSIFFQSTKRVFYVYSVIFVSTLIVMLFEIARIFFDPSFLAFGVFNGSASSILGKWNDMSIFFGFTSVLSLTILQLLTLKKNARIILYTALAFSLAFLVLTNFMLSWILVGLMSLILFVYKISLGVNVNKDKPSIKIPILPLSVSIIALVFLLPGNLGGILSAKLGISNIEARPSWAVTYDIAKDAVKENPLLGVSPNRFSNQWLVSKPAGINQTFFWNTNFNFGIGTIPSFVVTTGILGMLAWLAFLALLLYRGGKSLFIKYEEAHSTFISVSSFLASLYLWTVAIFYVPNIVNLSLAVLFTGIFIALLTKEKITKSVRLSFIKDPRVGFVSVLVLILLIILSIVTTYLLTQRFMSNYSFARSLVAFNIEGNIDSAEKNISKSISLYKYDTYYRALSEIQLARLSQILSSSNQNKETVRAQFQSALGNVINSARSAVDFDSSNYINWISLGRAYESVIPLNIEGSYENAIASYNKALELSPSSPSMYIILARTELIKGDTKKAKAFLEQALVLKSDYTQALFLLSQIAAQSGNIDEAIKQVEKASFIAPNDVGVFFQLGLLRYQNKDYTGAISALERAVILNSVYSNAKYFLGLSYYKEGRRDDAIVQFKDIKLLNPDNKEVKQILSNLENGYKPFSAAPSVQPPEDRNELPVEEQ